MAEFVDPAITQEITDAKDKLVAQADRAEQVITNWESCQPITEAPLDGNLYGRQNSTWTQIVTTATWGGISGLLSDQTDLQAALDSKLETTSYTAADVKTKYESNLDTNAFTDSEKTKLTGIEAGAQVNKFDFTDAPSDGQQYARQNGLWAVVTGGAGGATWGSITGTLSDQVDLQAALDAKIEVINLSAVVAPTTVTINNPEGNNAIIPSATTLDAGVLSASDKTKLDGIEAGAEVNNISDVNATDLTDGLDSTLHFHASDRDRSNHTGTQTASTISDFDTEVANNTAVAANTAKVSFPEAPIDGTPYARQDGGWVAAGGGSVSNLDITRFEMIDNQLKNPENNLFTSASAENIGTGDQFLTWLIARGIYPSGTTWNQVALQSFRLWTSTSLQTGERGDTGGYPVTTTSSVIEVEIYFHRVGGGVDYGGLDAMTLVAKDIGNADVKTWIRKATATTTGTWAQRPHAV